MEDGFDVLIDLEVEEMAEAWKAPLAYPLEVAADVRCACGRAVWLRHQLRPRNGRRVPLAGAEADRLHVNRLIESPEVLASYDILAIPGDFPSVTILVAVGCSAIASALHFATRCGISWPTAAPSSAFATAFRSGEDRLLPGRPPAEI